MSNFWHPMECNPPGSSVHWIFQARIWSGSPCSPLGDLPDLGIKPASPVLQEDSLLSEPSNGRSYYNYLMIMSPQTYWHLRTENINHLVTSTLTNQRTVTLLSHLAFKNALLKPFWKSGVFWSLRHPSSSMALQ